MNRRFRGSLMALGCAALAGCVAPPAAVTPADAVARLRTGEPLLSCREACLGEWQRAQPQAAQLAGAGRWADLAALTLRVNYQDDLSLYYLGRAAEGLGYPGAAASHYRQSTYLSGTTIACQRFSRMCGGIALPRAALLRLAAIDRSLARPRPRRGAPPSPEPGAPAPSAGEPEAPAAAEAAPIGPPQPTQLTPAALPPPPPPSIAAPIPVRPPSSEYIEPPPAAR